MVNNRIPIIIIVICVIAIAITFVVGMLARGKRVYKYIPFIISVLGGIGFYIRASFFSMGFDAIGYMLLMVAAGIFAAASLVTAVLMDLFLHYKKPGL